MIYSPALDAFAAFTDIRKNRINAALVDRTQTLGRNAQADPTVFTLNPEAVFVEIRVKHPFGFVVSVRDVMAYNTAFACHLAHSGHFEPLSAKVWRKTRLYN
jgi:hypothetical protein